VTPWLARLLIVPSIPGNISHAGILQHADNLSRQLTKDLDSIHARDIGLDALPLGDPASLWVGDGNHAVEVCAGAFRDGFGCVGEVEDGFAVGAAVGEKFLAERMIRRGERRKEGRDGTNLHPVAG